MKRFFIALKSGMTKEVLSDQDYFPALFSRMMKRVKNLRKKVHEKNKKHGILEKVCPGMAVAE